MIEIKAIPAFYDNYIWTIVHPKSKQIIVVDPGDARPVFEFLSQNQYRLCAILITHHHMDHIGGMEALHHQTQAPVYGPKDEAIGHCDFPLTEGDHIDLSEFFPISFDILSLPGHTLGHIAYYNPSMLFCGDTLFSAGCGRLFEGTPAQMHNSLNKLRQLPAETKVYCAHEYTQANLQFAATVEPNNHAIQQRIQQVQQLIGQDLPSLPSSIKVERDTNPFLRCDQPDVIQAAAQHANQNLDNPIDVFATLRQWKDSF